MIKKFVYIGHTQELERRIRDHNQGKSRSTKHYRPFLLFYYEEFNSKEEAIDREKKLKTGFYKESLREIAYQDGEVPLPSRQAGKWLSLVI